MQFETRIIDGKPSIFYKDDTPKTTSKKITTKNQQAKKEIRRSMEISGEVDLVKASPRQVNLKNAKQIKTITSVLNQNGIKLTSDQLLNLIQQVNPADDKQVSRRDPSEHRVQNYEPDYRQPTNKSNIKKQDFDYVAAYRQPQIVIADDIDYEEPKPKPVQEPLKNSNALNLNNKTSLMDKKKLKWQQDKETLEKLAQQENYDINKYVPPVSARPSSLPRTFQSPEPHSPIKNTMTLAEKKRLQWQQERDAQENLKKLPGSINDISNYRSNEPSYSNQLRKSNSLSSLVQEQQLHTATNDVNQNQQQRFSLMDKKKQKWNMEKDTNNGEHWPYGKPGVGVGRITNNNFQQDNHRQPKNFVDPVEELNRIKDQIDAITAQEQLLLNQPVVEEKQAVFHDQSKVPAAMRTSILFGGVMFDDDIKKTKEMERKKWLHDLEEQKKEKFIESQRPSNQPTQPNNYFNTGPSPSTKFFEDEKSFGRTRNLLDPAQIDEIERKRKQALQNKMEIEAQIAEKKRIKMLEEEIQNLNNLKIENEAKELKESNQIKEEIKKQNTHYQNFEKALNSSRPSNTDVAPSVLQGEYNKYDQESKTVRSNITETRSQEIYRKMQEAELAAAEEKHKKLLKRLQRGGHDTTQLERKFAELKARLTGNPPPPPPETQRVNNVNNHQISNIPGLNFSGIESSRLNNNASQLSVVSDHEARLERQKELLTKKLFSNKENETNSEQSKLQKIFQLLREDTTGLPAEITEEDLKMLLKKVVRAEDLPKVEKQKRPFKKEEKKVEEEVSNSGIGKDGKPIWNYKNLKGRKAVTNTQKDPFYHERVQRLEERKRERLEYYKSQSQRVGQRHKEFMEKKQTNKKNSFQDEDTMRDHRGSVMSSSSNVSIPYDDRKPPKSTSNHKNESIMNLLTKNLAANPIYEEDEDMFLKETKPIENYDFKLQNGSYSSFGDMNSNRGFVPFMRTNEVLDPTHAGSPIPPSREPSAARQNREKARQAYIQNMKPSDYGFSYDDVSNRNRRKDPLLNNGLVRNNPTPRQEQILSQLATLKQSLIQKQREIASSLSYDGNNDNYE